MNKESKRLNNTIKKIVDREFFSKPEPENTDPWNIAPQPTCHWVGNTLIHAENCTCSDGDGEDD